MKSIKINYDPNLSDKEIGTLIKIECEENYQAEEEVLDSLCKKEYLIKDLFNLYQKRYKYYKFFNNQKGYIKEQEDPELEDFVQKFRDKFKNTKPGAIGDKNTVKYKIQVFMNNYNYSKEIILKAAENYVKECSKQDYKYLARADNFIYKQGPEGNISLLSIWCDMVSSGFEDKSIIEML